MRRVVSFFGRRLSPREYLGLHLTLGLLVSTMALALFVLIAREVGGKELSAFDLDFALHMRESASEHSALLHFFRFVTNFGDVPAIATLTFVGGLLLAVQRRRLLTFVWFTAVLGGGLLNLGLKEGFERQRPPLVLRDPVATETNESFPSGHSMGSVIGYGMLAYVLILRMRRRSARFLVAIAFAVLVFLIGCSRVYLRAHWFSDVCGGFAMGTVWLTFCISGLEVVRRRKHARRLAHHAAMGERLHKGKPSEQEKTEKGGSS